MFITIKMPSLFAKLAAIRLLKLFFKLDFVNIVITRPFFYGEATPIQPESIARIIPVLSKAFE